MNHIHNIALAGNTAMTHFFLGQVYIQKAMYSDAMQHLKRAIDLFGESSNMLANYGYAAAKAGKLEIARDILRKLLHKSHQSYVSAYDITCLYIGLDDTDHAFEWLEKAFREKAYLLVYLKVDPLIDPLRLDTRFNNFLEKMNFET